MPTLVQRDVGNAFTASLLGVLLGASPVLPAQDAPPRDPRFGPAAKAEADARLARIRIRGVHLEKVPVPQAGWQWSTRAAHKR